MILRQTTLFLIIGLCLIAIDWAVFVILGLLGVMPIVGNILARFSGTLLGFWLNGKYTFSVRGEVRLGRVRLLKYLCLWIILTALSSILLDFVASNYRLETAWIIKPMLELALASISFIVHKFWIYR